MRHERSLWENTTLVVGLRMEKYLELMVEGGVSVSRGFYAVHCALQTDIEIGERDMEPAMKTVMPAR